LAGGGEERAGLGLALALFIGGDAVRHDTRTCLDMENPVLEHAGTQDDAGIDRAVRGEIADPARIGAAGFRFEFGDDLAGADFGGAGNGSGREPGEDRIDRVMLSAIQSSDHVRDDVHDVAVALDRVAVGHFDRACRRDAAYVVAPEIEQHEMLGPFLRIGEQAYFVGLVFRCRLPARAGARNWADRDFAVADADQDFRARTDQRKAGHVEEVEERRRIDAPE